MLALPLTWGIGNVDPAHAAYEDNASHHNRSIRDQADTASIKVHYMSCSSPIDGRFDSFNMLRKKPYPQNKGRS